MWIYRLNGISERENNIQTLYTHPITFCIVYTVLYLVEHPLNFLAKAQHFTHGPVRVGITHLAARV